MNRVFTLIIKSQSLIASSRNCSIVSMILTLWAKDFLIVETGPFDEVCSDSVTSSSCSCNSRPSWVWNTASSYKIFSITSTIFSVDLIKTIVFFFKMRIEWRKVEFVNDIKRVYFTFKSSMTLRSFSDVLARDFFVDFFESRADLVSCKTFSTLSNFSASTRSDSVLTFFGWLVVASFRDDRRFADDLRCDPSLTTVSVKLWERFNLMQNLKFNNRLSYRSYTY